MAERRDTPLPGAGSAIRLQGVQVAEETAEDREKARARSRGVDELEIDTLNDNTAWFLSNRVDDRTVVFERDPRHPGGELFLGGAGPDRGYRTGTVQRLLQSGEIIEVPEPRKTMMVFDPEAGEEVEVAHRKYPIDPGVEPGLMFATPPGRAAQLGRKMDKDMWDTAALQEVSRRQRGMGAELPVPQGVIVPRAQDIDRSV